MRNDRAISWTIALAAVASATEPSRAQELSATPTSGGLGTVITITVLDQSTAIHHFNDTTVIHWSGSYAPPMGAPTAPFDVNIAAGDVTLVDEWTVSAPIGAGAFSNAPSLESLLGFGVLVGTLTTTTQRPCAQDINGDDAIDGGDIATLLANWGSCPSPPAPCPADFNGDGAVDGADIAFILANWGPCTVVFSSPFNFGISSNAATWARVDYPDGFGGLAAPLLGGELDELPMYLLSLSPDPLNPVESQFVATSDNHVAAVLRVEKNAATETNPPASISAEIISYDASDIEIDRLPLDLVLSPVQNDPNYIIYHNALDVPLLFVDTPVIPQTFPGFHLVLGAVAGSAVLSPILIEE